MEDGYGTLMMVMYGPHIIHGDGILPIMEDGIGALLTAGIGYLDTDGLLRGFPGVGMTIIMVGAI